MKRKTLILTAAVAAIVIGAAALVPAYAHGPGYGMGWGGGPGYGMGMMGQGQGQGYGMGPGMMGQGQGYGMGPGMMGQGQGYGMGPGMMGQGMGPGMMGQGQQAYGPGNCPFAATQGAEVTVDSVTKFLEARIAHWGGDRLKVGKVEAADDKTITGEIVTKDGSLVQKFAFDKQTGWPRRVN